MKSQDMVNKRNGKIEFYRFFFSIAVLLFHTVKYIDKEPSFNKGVKISLFSHGAMGCEFFFIVSGYLMAKSINKRILMGNSPNTKCADEYLGFIRKKYTDIFPEHVAAFLLAFVTLVANKGYNLKECIKYAIDCIPSFFLIQMTGINFSSPNHVEWYISCMLIAMALIYPICRKWYYQFTRYFSWIGALLILGYIIYTGGCLSGVTVWTGVCYRSVLRAIAEISLGAAAFELSLHLSKRSWSKAEKLMLTILEIFSLVVTIILMVFTFKKKYEIYALASIFLLVVIAFSHVTYGSSLFDNRFCYFLGKASLPVYLGQLSAIYIVNGFFDNYSVNLKILAVVVLTFGIAAVIYICGKIIRLFVKKIKSKQSDSELT